MEKQMSYPLNSVICAPITIALKRVFKQRTIRNSIAAEGIALHSGKNIHIKLLPAPIDSGIIFRRVDITPHSEIKANALNVSETQLSTTLSNEHCKIALIEHFLSAVAGLGIDNLLVEVDGDEMPIMDGSASPFVFLIQSAGIQEQDAHKKFIKILDDVVVELEDKRVSLSPYGGFMVDFTIDFKDDYVKGKNNLCLDFSATTFIREISRSRTFGFEKDIERLREMGLIKGGTLKNAVLIKDKAVFNEEGLRSEDELVKHKILDSIGDLYLLGYSLIGKYTAFKSGHHLNNLLLRKLLAHSECWEVFEFNANEEIPISYNFGNNSKN